MARAADEVTAASARGGGVALRVAALLHPDTDSEQVMRTAQELAHRMQAELLGLFLEDIELLHLAGMPFAREICFPCATQRRLDPARIERGMQAVRARLEAAFGAAAGDRPRSFRVARGSWSAMLMEMAAQADVVVTASVSPAARRGRAGEAARALVVLCGGSITAEAFALLARMKRESRAVSDFVLVGPIGAEAEAAALDLAAPGRVIRVADREALRAYAQAMARGAASGR